MGGDSIEEARSAPRRPRPVLRIAHSPETRAAGVAAYVRGCAAAALAELADVRELAIRLRTVTAAGAAPRIAGTAWLVGAGRVALFTAEHGDARGVVDLLFRALRSAVQPPRAPAEPAPELAPLAAAHCELELAPTLARP